MEDELSVAGETCAKAWLAASRAVVAAGGEAYNVKIRVADPLAADAMDAALIGEVDAFLKLHRHHPVVTVANTIFPEAYARPRSAAELYASYAGIITRMRRMTGDWGRYFERMTLWQTRDGTLNQLDEMIESMRTQIAAGQVFGSTFEIAIYDPVLDRKRRRGRQCLSFLSFKLEKAAGGHRLSLTAVYRNHHYIARGLGNLIGLGRLMRFVAREAGLGTIGSLTCLSTHAEVDGGAWSKRDAKLLLTRCGALAEDQPVTMKVVKVA